MASIRNFIVSFLLSGVLFSVIAYYSIGFVVGLVSKPTEEASGSSEGNELYQLTTDATGMLSLLLIGIDEIGQTELIPPSIDQTVESEAEPTVDPIRDPFDQMVDADSQYYDTKVVFISLVCFNSYRQQVSVTAFPLEMTLKANDVELDLDTAYCFAKYELYGLTKDYFVEAIAATVGIPIDYSATIDVDDYVKVADNLGGLTVNCPEGDSASGVTVGENRLTSEQLHSLLIKDDYANARSKTDLVTNVTVAALDRICSIGYYVNAFEEFERISSMLGDTEFDADALSEWRPLIFSYKFYALQKLAPLGTYATEDGKTVFKIDRNGTVNYFKQYMQIDQTNK